MQLAFWQAQDRRSVTTGPPWLWRGNLVAPMRASDVSAAAADKVRARAAAGVPEGQRFDVPGPRQNLLPRWATARSAAGWAAVAAVLAVVAAWCAHARDDRIRIGEIVGWAGAASATVAVLIAALVVWGARDPLRLTAAEDIEIAQARRTLTWNPLAHGKKITPGAAYALEGIAVCERLRVSPAWTLPGVDILSWRFDADEEIFQIAKAAHALEERDRRQASLREQGIAAAADTALIKERKQLTDALLQRLTALHLCLDTLTEIEQRARSVGRVEDVDAPSWTAGFTAVAENELAAEALAQLDSDLDAMVEAYRSLRA
ncbi:hypothetical protein MycrhDRAFT_5582 [Mycolicibacterium rhodesiae JS60]|nr:hypothetical protein MycrhDRAFT_5582 [Mycolicibacterium rhodesiae JS60]